MALTPIVLVGANLPLAELWFESKQGLVCVQQACVVVFIDNYVVENLKQCFSKGVACTPVVSSHDVAARKCGVYCRSFFRLAKLLRVDWSALVQSVHFLDIQQDTGHRAVTHFGAWIPILDIYFGVATVNRHNKSRQRRYWNGALFR